IENDFLHEPTMAVEENNQLWIADDENGIVSNPAGTFVSYLPNGPSNSKAFKLSFNNKIVYSLGGGYSTAHTPLGSKGRIDQFSQGSWSQQSSTLLDLTDIAFNSNADLTYISSFGYGIEERNMTGSLKTLDENNSPLINTNFPSRSVTISSIERSNNGLWVANYGATQSLHFLSDQNSWESYSFSVAASRYPLMLAVDFFNNVWVVLNPAQGGGVLVFNKEENVDRYLSNADGSGGLPSKAVRSIAVDREGLVWIGTDEGVCYFYSTNEVFSPGVDAIKPIFENRFLLRDDKVTAIAVDGGNRKWIGTERGVWLFSPSGEKLFYNFTAENSPLLSNAIVDIEINDETGEVFFATDQGLVSFRADATESTLQFGAIKIFPNPVTPNFQGTVGISGLATDAIVKITDISGKLIWETRAYGGTASWNMNNYNGRRAKTGIYLVFSSSSDGAESVVGKIAIIE
ncbi:MAG TPA: two-component regulator propeller domain-containing protein, partial [Chryseolinea sp.]|nr:two-component regulator propeller domain-containing protein [Chryseolinea sp.]